MAELIKCLCSIGEICEMCVALAACIRCLGHLGNNRTRPSGISNSSSRSLQCRCPSQNQCLILLHCMVTITAICLLYFTHTENATDDTFACTWNSILLSDSNPLNNNTKTLTINRYSYDQRAGVWQTIFVFTVAALGIHCLIGNMFALCYCLDGSGYVCYFSITLITLSMEIMALILFVYAGGDCANALEQYCGTGCTYEWHSRLDVWYLVLLSGCVALTFLSSVAVFTVARIAKQKRKRLLPSKSINATVNDGSGLLYHSHDTVVKTETIVTVHEETKLTDGETTEAVVLERYKMYYSAAKKAKAAGDKMTAVQYLRQSKVIRKYIKQARDDKYFVMREGMLPPVLDDEIWK